MNFREFPSWIHLDDERLFSVVCTPSGDYHDLGVVLLTGGNYTRTHRNRMWVFAARELAQRGFPSIRIDYHGVGDSTGEAHFDMEAPFQADAVAAASFLQEATGVSSVAIVATCFGGRSAVSAAASFPEASGVVVFPVPLSVPGSAATESHRSRAKGWLKRRSWGIRLLQTPFMRRMRGSYAPASMPEGRRISPRFKEELHAFAQRGSVRFVYGEHSADLADLRRCLVELQDKSGSPLRRVNVDLLPDTDLHRFQRVSDQRLAIDATVSAVSKIYDEIGASRAAPVLDRTSA